MALDRTETSRRLLDVEDPAMLLYGALIAASVLATASSSSAHITYIALATGVVLVTYWLAHIYTASQSLQLAGDTRRFVHRLAHTSVQELGVVLGGLPAMAVYLVASLFGATAKSAASTAVYFSVAVLIGIGYLAARRAGRRGFARVADAATAGCFGVLVIIAKAQLH